MKARYIILIYYGSDYKKPGSVERTSFEQKCNIACSVGKRLSEHFNKYVEVWDIVRDKIVWLP